MKIILGVIALVAVGCFLWADYRWRQWMRARREERTREQGRDVN